MITYRAILRNGYYHTEILENGECVESHPYEYTNFTENELKDSIELTVEEFRDIIKLQNTGKEQECLPPPRACAR
jgi:hypothetical protein